MLPAVFLSYIGFFIFGAILGENGVNRFAVMSMFCLKLSYRTPIIKTIPFPRHNTKTPVERQSISPNAHADINSSS
jgi:hypothetical protein